MSSADDPCKQFGPRSGPQTFWHSDGIPEIFFFKMLALKKEKNSRRQTCTISQHAESLNVSCSFQLPVGRRTHSYRIHAWLVGRGSTRALVLVREQNQCVLGV